MKVFLKSAFKWLGLGAVFGLGTSAVASSTGVVSGISDFFNSAILVAAGVFLVWLLFKLIKK